MATDERPLPLEVRGHSAKAIAAGETGPIRGHSAKAIAAAETGPTGTSEQPDIPHGLNGTTGPSVTNASTFVPEPMWQTPIRRRSVTEYALDPQPGFVPGAFDPIVVDPVFGHDTSPADEPPEPPKTVALEGASVIALAGSVAPRGTVQLGQPSTGSAVLANRDAILLQSASIQWLLVDAITKAKADRLNDGSVQEMEAILVAVKGLDQILLTSTAPDEAVREKATSLKEGLANWWTEDHASILDRGYNWALFTSAVGICVLAGAIPSAIAAVLVRPKETVEALKEINKFFGRGQ